MGTSTPEERARHRAKEWVDLLWHSSSFVVCNVFLWAVDLVTHPGLQWAYWVTVAWGVGLLFHVASYAIDSREVMDRTYERFLAEERERAETDDPERASR